VSSNGSGGLIGILRGLDPTEATRVGDVLYGAGFRSLEVPLNSPEPFTSIRRLRDHLPDDALVGAGTVLAVEDVRRAQDAGALTVVSPNTDPAVIRETVARGMLSYPGAATPTEAFSAVAAGTLNVKIFPSGQVGPAGLKAWREVLPQAVLLFPVGGVDAEDFEGWVAAGAAGFGLGSALYRPDRDLDELESRARRLVAAWQDCVGRAAGTATGTAAGTDAGTATGAPR
jgi:2-dehydro-3-deoxyphosphogalactonate aldolase